MKLHDVGLRRRRIGIVGLEASEPGEIPAGYVAALATAFPKLTWVDFTRQLDAIREQKSSEETAFLRRSAAIADAAFDAAVMAARPGTSVRAIESIIIETLCRLGSELPIHVRWRSPRGSAGPEAWEGATFDAGSPWIVEIEAAWGGYRVRRSWPLGNEPIDATYSALHQHTAELWHAMMVKARPGATGADISATVNRMVSTAGFAGLNLTHTVSLRGCGLGADLPRFAMCQQDPNSPIPTGSCFSLRVTLGDGLWATQMEQPVLMTGRRLQALGSNNHGLPGPS
jgi:Xaa-Pro aminopeptidase